MSSEPRTQDAFIEGNESTIEQDASHSPLFYILQEVSKLVSPIHDSFLDTDSSSTLLHETSGQGPVIVKEEEEDAHFFQISNSSCQHSLSCMSPQDQIESVKEESHSSMVTTSDEQHPQRYSPWLVMSLIDLQCERLLHHGDVKDPSLVSSTTMSGDSTDKLSPATEDVSDQRACGNNLTCVSLAEDLRLDFCRGDYKPQWMSDSKVDCCVQSETAEQGDTLSGFSVKRQLEWNQECKTYPFSSEQDAFRVSSENVLPQTHILDASLNAQLTFNANDEASVAKPKLTLDHNANIALTTEHPYDTQLPPPSSNILPASQSASFLFCTTENCQSLAEQEKIPASIPEYTHVHIKGKCPPVVQLKSSSCNGETNPSSIATSEAEPSPAQKGEITAPSPQQWSSKTPRKQLHPCRSGDSQDPDFQGVAFRMGTELDDNKEQYRLLITSKFRMELSNSVRKNRLRPKTSLTSSDEECSPTSSPKSISPDSKVCASCCTRTTPMWRDAEDGTPLCNACGIRFKKYRVRCVNCWHIPRKEDNSNSCCLKCGHFVRLSRKPPSSKRNLGTDFHV